MIIYIFYGTVTNTKVKSGLCISHFILKESAARLAKIAQVRPLSLAKGTNLSVESSVSTLRLYSVQAGSTSGLSLLTVSAEFTHSSLRSTFTLSFTEEEAINPMAFLSSLRIFSTASSLVHFTGALAWPESTSFVHCNRTFITG